MLLLPGGTLQGVPEGRPDSPAFFWSPTGEDATFFTSLTRGEFAQLVRDVQAAVAGYARAGATCTMSMGKERSLSVPCVQQASVGLAGSSRPRHPPPIPSIPPAP